MTVHDTQPDLTFPADHAFVVQLRRGAKLTAEAVTGQVEHIVSGQSAEFHSFAELAAFMAQRLNAPSEEPS